MTLIGSYGSAGASVGAGWVSPDGDDRGSDQEGGSVGDVELIGQQGIGCFWRRFGRPGWGCGQRGRWGVYGGDEEGQPDATGDRVDCGDGEGSDGGWHWGVVQRESGGRPGELEWCQLRRIGQSGSSGDDSPDNYWQLNLA